MVPASFDRMIHRVGRAFLLVERGGKWGSIDYAGRVLVPLEFEAIGSDDLIRHQEYAEDRLAAKLGGKWGYIDRPGKFAIAPAYQEALPFLDGIAVVKAGGKFGFVDRAGKVVMPIEHHRVQHGANIVIASGKLYDTAGRRTPSPVLEAYQWREADPSGVILFADILDDDRFGLADRNGRILAGPEFHGYRDEHNPRAFRDGLLRVYRPSTLGPYSMRIDAGLLSVSGRFEPVQELGSLFGPYPRNGLSATRMALLIGAMPGVALLSVPESNPTASWYGVVLRLLVFPLLFALWWVSAWRVALRHVARVDLDYRRAWRGMLLWIVLTAIWTVTFVWLLQDRQAVRDLGRDIGDAGSTVFFLSLISLPPLFGVFIARAHASHPGRALKPWIAGLLAFLAFAALSSAPFAIAEAGVDWHESGWTLVALAMLFGLSTVVRKRNASAADSLRELSFAGFAGWGVVLLWLQAAVLFGAYV